MRKLSLDLGDLEVETFRVPAAEAVPGTVRGMDATVTCVYPQCGTQAAVRTCYAGCTTVEA